MNAKEAAKELEERLNEANDVSFSYISFIATLENLPKLVRLMERF